MGPSPHPTLEVAAELRDTVERVRSGIEQVIVLTDVDGKPLAALVSMASLALLDERAVAERNDAAMEASDTVGMQRR